jgi:hypothetical protein
MTLKLIYFHPLYLPVRYWSHVIHKRRHKRYLARKQHDEHATQAWYSRLPPVRPVDEARPLKDTLRNISTQSEAVFFSKLPLEIRRLIYEHLWDREELFFQVPEESTMYRGDEITRENIPFTLTCPAAQNILGFPTSCKRAYVQGLAYK